MKVNVKKIKIFKMKNRKGYAAICLDRLTEGSTLHLTYDRMIKALKRGKIEVSGRVCDIKHLVTTFK